MSSGEILRRFKKEYQRLNGEIGVMDLEAILNEAEKEFPKIAMGTEVIETETILEIMKWKKKWLK